MGTAASPSGVAPIHTHTPKHNCDGGNMRRWKYIRVAQSEFRKILRFRKPTGLGGAVAEKSSLGTREIPRVSKVQWRWGGGGEGGCSQKKITQRA